MTVYGYLRVSTDKQECDNQKIGVEALARKLGLPIESWIIDNGVSGTKEPQKRKLGKLLRKIKTGDIIICSELSRLGRKLFMVISILEHCMKIGAKVLTAKRDTNWVTTCRAKFWRSRSVWLPNWKGR